MNQKIVEMVADRVIAEMEKGVIPWRKPWIGANGAVSHETGKGYSFINQLMMPAGEYITFNQCKAEKGQVKKGAKGYPVVFWKVYKKEEENAAGEKETHNIPVLKYYTVFNIDDCIGVEKKFFKDGEKPVINPIENCEDIIFSYFANTGIKLNNQKASGKAYYEIQTDSITVPMISQFPAIGEYYSTLFHEMTHSTGHESRLNRQGITNFSGFGSENYSKEELIAEIGAAALVNYCGIETAASFENSTAYLENWLAALKNDKSLIIAAAGKAQKAFEYILNFATGPIDNGPDGESETETKPESTSTAADNGEAATGENQYSKEMIAIANNMPKICTVYNSIYNFMYDGRIEDTSEMVDAFEKFTKRPDFSLFARRFFDIKNDIMTSDREYAAMACTLGLCELPVMDSEIKDVLVAIDEFKNDSSRYSFSVISGLDYTPYAKEFIAYCGVGIRYDFTNTGMAFYKLDN